MEKHAAEKFIRNMCLTGLTGLLWYQYLRIKKISNALEKLFETAVMDKIPVDMMAIDVMLHNGNYDAEAAVKARENVNAFVRACGHFSESLYILRRFIEFCLAIIAGICLSAAFWGNLSLKITAAAVLAISAVGSANILRLHAKHNQALFFRNQNL
ncbi:MAG TPA: hypothetical protein PLM07_18795 [Candidatus Rifleibacterium sp.]|nr:hypothetical protein [Candidatus Rifleibacterium sp.]HPT47933.1 hypothetical protein [Candidatus Rifleibacterium sp.]